LYPTFCLIASGNWFKVCSCRRRNGLDLFKVMLNPRKSGVGFVLSLMRFRKVCKE
jgi:hypothetical protein